MKPQQVQGNLLEVEVGAFVHQANLHHIFGGGIAYQILTKFPAAYEADKQTPRDDESKLGTFSFAIVERDFGLQHIINMYSQIGMTNTSYGHMIKALAAIRQHLETYAVPSVGFAYNMGCGIANGSWPQVEKLIEDAFAGSDIKVLIVKYN